jgi:hypothetical protein
MVEFQLFPLLNLPQVALATGNATEATRWAHRLIDAAEQTLSSREYAAGHTYLARAALRGKGFEAACSAAAKALSVAVETDDKLATTWVVETVAQIVWATGNPTDAAILHAGAETLRNQVGFVHPAPRVRELEHEYHQIRQALGTDNFNTAWKTGTSLSKEELTPWLAAESSTDDTTGNGPGASKPPTAKSSPPTADKATNPRPTLAAPWRR